ncbi:MAG: hypothetical protein KF875_09350 [Trueperaceae bacterium]|nr:hypothetical protein [Trueperaceae bacterium]MCO5174701.1 hypothetical protein [Trueperaceae bacterium]
MTGAGAAPDGPVAPTDEGRDPAAQARAWAEEHVGAGLRPSARARQAPAARLAELTRKLARAHRAFGVATAAKESGSYAAEWFLDNYYLIRESVRQATQDLPTDFYRRLPCLADGAVGGGAARAEALAVLLLDESAGRLDVARAGELLEAYQTVAPLSMGELWALPSLLRLVLLDWLTKSAELLTAPPDRETDDAERESHNQRVADCIVGLRTVKSTDWRVFFEAASHCERELRRDASGDYAGMTFATRDRYRKAVERVARRTGADEVAVAGEAVRLSRAAGEDPAALRRTRHVGYYLIDHGARALEDAFGYRRGVGERSRAFVKAHPTLVYLGSVGLVAAVLLAWGGAYAAASGAAAWLVALAIALLLVPAFTVAVAVVNYALNRLIAPALLPRLDFGGGLPRPAGDDDPLTPRYAALVVMPVLVASLEELDALLGQLERHYLGNPDPRLAFALLTDFPDAAAATLPGEADLLAQARRRVARLNGAYGRAAGGGAGVAGAGGRFYLLHRGRRWNASEGVWMGWERKRGKLMELNRLLRGADDTTFELIVGDVAELSGTEYVLTLDADTRLPPGAAPSLIGTLAHPLNRAEFDADGRVVAGYSLLQPRTDVLPESANASRFSRLFVGENGLDLYTHAVSDVYQDLFGAAIFVGKGLYRVDDFQRALAGRVPENSLLSHDLLEGIYGGVALVSDVVLFEEYPPTYLAQVKRAQRWVRGDWQLLPWLLATLVGARGRGERLGPAGAWKIADNLRRSLVAPALFALFVAGWLVLPGSPGVWTLIALSTLAAPLLAGAVIAYLDGLIENYTVPGRRRLMPWQPLSQAFGRFAITLSFVPYEAGMVARSVSLTLYRLFVTHRNLLEWRTAALTNREPPPTLGGDVRRMGWALALSVAAALAVAYLRPAALLVAAVPLVVWLLAPVTAHLLSLASDGAPRELTDAERRELHGLARRTWLYFERFVGPEDNWLPPDNVQLGHDPVTAHRTSPTNVGLMLLSTLAAHDLGYLGVVDLSLRLRQTLDVLGRVERYRGHLLNWYDTRSLEPLHPRYVSSVDSGNFAAALVALRQGCLQLLERPMDVAAFFGGLTDALAVLEDALFTAMPERPAAAAVAALRERVESAALARELWPSTIALLEGDAWPSVEQAIVTAMHDGDLTGRDLDAVRLWAERVRHGIRVTLGEVGSLAPWVRALGAAQAWTGSLPEGSPARVAWRAVAGALASEPPLREVGAWVGEALAALRAFRAALGDESAAASAGRAWCDDLAPRLASARNAAAGLVRAFEELAARSEAEVEATDFTFLYDPDRQLLHIGYNVDTEQLDTNHYDLLASESRLASLVAVAKSDVPISHWVHLNRPLSDLGGRAALLSWSGTMFEYLMPELLTRRYGATLLDQSCAAAVDVQMAFAKRNGVPWGVSESGYARVDAAGNYQYHAFGVPELALNRSYSSDLVIAPYASMLALRHRPEAVLENAARLAEAGALGPHGFFEALDFTPERRPLGADRALVRSHMAHHQGMILLAVANALTDDAMVERFHADPRVATVEYLLQERIPLDVPVIDDLRPEESPSVPVDVATLDEPWPVPVDTATPLTHLLSNGSYTVLLSEAGGGWSAAGDVAITRWRPDGTRDADGTWIFVRDEPGGSVWSATPGPLPSRVQDERVVFYPYKVEYQREFDGILTRLEVVVARGAAELRRLTVVNRGETSRVLRVTSYAEVVLGSAAADARHPAFSKLFVESSFLAGRSAILFHRRPRSADEAELFAAHAVVSRDDPGPCEYETDRAVFLGRGNDVTTAVGTRGPLRRADGDGGTGAPAEPDATLDPAMALAVRLELEPHSQEEVTFVTGSGASARELTDLLDELRKPGMVAREFDLARLRSRVELQEHDLTPATVETYQRLYSAVAYPLPELRAPAATLASNTLGQPALWGQGISGDMPIVLVRLDSTERLPLVVETLRAHAYWRRRGVKVDVVVLNTQDTAYDQTLHARLRAQLVRLGSDEWLGARGGIYLLRRDQLAQADLVALESAARVVLDGEHGSLAEQLRPLGLPPRPGLPLLAPVMERQQGASEGMETTDLRYDNGWGGFTADGREYVIRASRGALPPAPWSNVMANEVLGCLTTEAGLGATWAVNSGENRLTPWSNDPVTDPSAEAVYLRDEETTEVWSATPHPAGGDAAFEARHSAGRTTYRHVSHGLEQVLEVSVAAQDPVKLVRLSVRNLSDRPRRVTVTYYAEWVLGVDRQSTSLHLLPDYVPERCALLVRNPYSTDFGERVAFLAGNKTPHGVTTDRREFLGRWGSPAMPDALRRVGLSGAVAPGGDPCGAMQLHLDLGADGSEDVLFVLGETEGRASALELADRYRDLGAYAEARAAAEAAWDARLDKVRVSTPDPALDLLTNRWLVYQTLSSRYFGRTAFYQPGGAYGFRDQLQDVVALLHAAPELARAQLLRAAAHQFEEGDVLHWWHPPSGRGVRTRISDDLLWLVYAAERYVTTTGESGVLDEVVPFLHGRPLAPGAEDRYDAYAPGQGSGTLLEHCRRAMEKGATVGKHGLPLMGTGDWNDGMNRVGAAGKGESVWLAWFLVDVIRRFVGLLDRVGGSDGEAERWTARADAYARACDGVAWDGRWYLRAFYDDGTPLGTGAASEWRIDSIAQSWAVLAGAAPAERATVAMRSVEELCVRWEEGLIRLATPPFDRSQKDPGYIKGYLPGVRENGGQYTHGAIWSAWAFARLGERGKAHALHRLLDPVLHAADREGAERYVVEPYVLAADVYGQPPHVGRGGWSWYTGSAAWFYRFGLEGLLGLERVGDELRLDPHVPAEWPGFEVRYRHGASTYVLRARPGTAPANLVTRLVDDGVEHVVDVVYAA